MKYWEPKHFIPQEYVPKEIYDVLGDKSLLVMDYRVLKTDDAIREFFGVPVIINTWHDSKMVKKYGLRRYSGYRPFQCKVGAAFSQHKFGRASDKVVVGIDIKTVRRAIIDNQRHFPYITVIEDKVSWLHTDCRCIIGSEIQLIKGV